MIFSSIYLQFQIQCTFGCLESSIHFAFLLPEIDTFQSSPSSFDSTHTFPAYLILPCLSNSKAAPDGTAYCAIILTGVSLMAGGAQPQTRTASWTFMPFFLSLVDQRQRSHASHTVKAQEIPSCFAVGAQSLYVMILFFSAVDCTTFIFSHQG
jgi:hypothetical protein